MKNPILSIPNYFSSFKTFIGNRIFIIFVLASFASISEGLGLVMLIPFFESIGLESIGPSSSQSFLEEFLERIFILLGIKNSSIGILIFIALFFIIKGALVFSALSYNSVLRGKMLYSIKSKIFKLFVNLNYSYYISKDSGYYANLMNEQAYRAMDAFRNLTVFFTQLISIIMYIGIVFFIAPRFGLASICIGAILIVFFKRINNYVRSLSFEIANSKGLLIRKIVETVQGFKYLISTAQINKPGSDILKLMKYLSNIQIRAGIASSLTSSLKEPIAILFVCMMIAINLVFLNENITGVMVAILLFYRTLNAMIMMQGSLQVCMEFIGSMELITKEIKKMEINQDFSGSEKKFSIENQIEFKDAYINYGQSSETEFGPFSIRIPKNSLIAITGKSGSGKSSIVNLVTMLMEPSSGEFYIDGINYINIDKEAYRSMIGYVSQDSVVFQESIFENISFSSGIRGNDQEVILRVEEAAKLANIHDFIKSLPHGYNTILGERGVTISGGQRQRILIARELFKRPKILILDEATSSLDDASENKINEVLINLKGKITLLMISHKLKNLSISDYIYVLNKGKVSEEGVYENLVKDSNSIFSNIN